MRRKLFLRLWIVFAVGLFLAGWLMLIVTAHAQQQIINPLVLAGLDPAIHGPSPHAFPVPRMPGT